MLSGKSVAEAPLTCSAQEEWVNRELSQSADRQDELQVCRQHFKTQFERIAPNRLPEMVKIITCHVLLILSIVQGQLQFWEYRPKR